MRHLHDGARSEDVTVDDLASPFEEQRPHLRAVAYRLLGSVDDADDALRRVTAIEMLADAERLRDLDLEPIG